MSDGLSFNDTPIVIDNWQRDDTYLGVYPSGARVKDAYFSPKEPEDTCIKSNWRYLFKLSRRRFPWQFWCEIIAYRFGCVIGVKVPPAHIGYSKNYEKGVDTYAALIEWFYDDKKVGYISGGQIMVELIENFDRDTGKEHNLETIREFFSNREKILEYWAKVLTFDALIGNRDRHQDNWGVIFDRISLKRTETEITLIMSPAFDNGTALGYEILEQKIENFDDAGKLEHYLTHKKASHHMKWSLDESKQLNFYEFMKRFTLEFPEAKDIIARCLDFAFQEVEEVLAPLVVAIPDPEYKLTRKRLDFVLKQLFERKRILEETLEL